jgi:hypothetical protein
MNSGSLLAFALLWTTLVVVGGLFIRRASIPQKRAWLPRFRIGTALLFVAFVALATRNAAAVLFMGAAVAVVTWVNLRRTRVCSACGAVPRGPSPFSPPEKCDACGAKLD